MSQDLDELVSEPSTSPSRDSFLPLLRMAWQRKSLLLLGVVVGLVLSALAYARKTPLYQSFAQVLVIKKSSDALAIPGVEPRYSYYYDDYLATHQTLLRSPLVLGRAAKRPEIQGLQSFADFPNPMKLIMASLSVSREKDSTGITSNILNLSYRGLHAKDCGIILDAVIRSYREFLEETYQNVSAETVKLITQAKDDVQKSLVQKEAEYRAFRQTTPLFMKGKDGNNVHQIRLANIETRRSALVVRRGEVQGRLSAIDKALKAGQNREILIAMIAEGYGKPNSDDPRRNQPAGLEEHLLPLLLLEETLTEDYGPAHPQVRSVHKRIELAREFFARRPGSRAKVRDPGSQEEAKELDPIQAHIEILKQELEDLSTVDQSLSEMFDREREEARKVLNYEIQDETIRNEIQRTQQLYDGIIKRLQEIDIIKGFGGFEAQTVSPPESGFQIEPRALPIFAMGLVFGMLGGFGLAYLAEISDKSFRTPEEIRRRLGLPVVGHIPYLLPEEDAQPVLAPNGVLIDPVLCTYHLPKSVEAEAFRGVRTALYFSLAGKGHQLIQITSPDMSDGKSTVAANIAISIAQSQKTILLIDADFRRPNLHKLFGLSVTRGFASVLAEEADPGDAIVPGPVSGLALLPCGPLPPNPAELLTSSRLQTVLDLLRQRYDFVLVDTPPLLAVTDPSIVAARVDGVLLTLRPSKSGRPHAERAKEVLATLGAHVLGVIVNETDRHARGGYSYEHYHYGYRYGYGADDESENDKAGTTPPEMAAEHPAEKDLPDQGGTAVEGRQGPAASRAEGAPPRRRRRPAQRGLSRWIRSWW